MFVSEGDRGGLLRKIQQREDLKGRSDFREVDVDRTIILKSIVWKYFFTDSCY
jgi:hypothetical protein